jgi:23S rRNA (cytosine1962-C5)-methyltransferase
MKEKLPKIILKQGKEKPVLRGHPWVFSGAVLRMEGEVSPGDAGEAYSEAGEFLGTGHINPLSQIVLRVFTQRKESLGADFFRERMLQAAALREMWFSGKTNAYRLVNGEGDLLPGLVVDRYGDYFVLQCLTAGIERMKGVLTDLLVELFHPRGIYERSDASTRKEEGLKESIGLLHGETIPDRIQIEEEGCLFRINVKKGHKTGFYLDQRENRLALKEVSRGKKILDCFCYTGGFSTQAAMGGAVDLTLVDSSEEALSLAEEHFQLNGLSEISRQMIRGDVFDVMRRLEPGYDIVMMDPPPFAKKKGNLAGAARGYKDLNLQAFRLLKTGGLLFTFSCSHYMDWDLFQKSVFYAAMDAGKKVQLISRRGHPIDHPVLLSHPEGEYLKGLICRVL